MANLLCLDFFFFFCVFAYAHGGQEPLSGISSQELPTLFICLVLRQELLLAWLELTGQDRWAGSESRGPNCLCTPRPPDLGLQAYPTMPGSFCAAEN